MLDSVKRRRQGKRKGKLVTLSQPNAENKTQNIFDISWQGEVFMVSMIRLHETMKRLEQSLHDPVQIMIQDSLRNPVPTSAALWVSVLYYFLILIPEPFCCKGGWAIVKVSLIMMSTAIQYFLIPSILELAQNNLRPLRHRVNLPGCW